MIQISDCRETIRQLENQNDLWNHLIFLNEHRTLLRGLREAFCGVVFKLSDCQAFSPFETVPGSLGRNFSSVNNMANLW